MQHYINHLPNTVFKCSITHACLVYQAVTNDVKCVVCVFLFSFLKNLRRGSVFSQFWSNYSMVSGVWITKTLTWVFIYVQSLLGYYLRIQLLSHHVCVSKRYITSRYCSVLHYNISFWHVLDQFRNVWPCFTSYFCMEKAEVGAYFVRTETFTSPRYQYTTHAHF